MRRTHADPLRTRLAALVVMSCVLHYPVLRMVVKAVNKEVKPSEVAPSLPSRQNVTMLSEAQLRTMMAKANRLTPPKPIPKKEKDKEKQKEKEKEKFKNKGQIVEIPPPAREEIPKDSNLLSDFNSSTDKQTVKRSDRPPTPEMIKGPELKISTGNDRNGTTTNPKKAKPKPRSEDKSPRRQAKGPAKRQRPGALKNPSRKLGDPNVAQKQQSKKFTEEVPPGPKGLAAGEGLFNRHRDQVNEAKPDPGGSGPLAGGAGAPPDYASLLPSVGPQEMARADGSIDKIEDAEEGAETALNTREYKYAWFFNRVKNRVQQHWEPGSHYRRRDPYGRVHGRRDRVTVLEVTLDRKGKLQDIFVARNSGVAFLDEVAVQAFREAEPFPNPPGGLVAEDGLIKFKFAFYLEFNRPGLRWFR